MFHCVSIFARIQDQQLLKLRMRNKCSNIWQIEHLEGIASQMCSYSDALWRAPEEFERSIVAQAVAEAGPFCWEGYGRLVLCSWYKYLSVSRCMICPQISIQVARWRQARTEARAAVELETKNPSALQQVWDWCHGAIWRRFSSVVCRGSHEKDSWEAPGLIDSEYLRIYGVWCATCALRTDWWLHLLSFCHSFTWGTCVVCLAREAGLVPRR